MQLTHLSRKEASDFGRLEETIAVGLDTFISVGKALAEIRDRRLYRDGHDTFEGYCRERWNFSKTHANRLIASASAVENLGNVEVVPINEAQARPLALLPPDKQAAAWQKAVSRAPDRRVTANDVRAAVDELLDNTPGRREIPATVTFVDRNKIVGEWNKYAKDHGVPPKYLELVSAWLRTRLDR